MISPMKSFNATQQLLTCAKTKWFYNKTLHIIKCCTLMKDEVGNSHILSVYFDEMSIMSASSVAVINVKL